MRMNRQGGRKSGQFAACGLVVAMTMAVTMETRAAPVYTITDLGTLPGTTQSIATGINASGQVAGVSYSKSDGTWIHVETNISYDAGARSFLYNSGKGLTPISPTDGPANAINDAGQVVGGQFSSINDSGQYVGGGISGMVHKDQGSFPDQVVSGGTSTQIPYFEPIAINNSGEVGGNVRSLMAQSTYDAAIYQNGKVTDLSQTLGIPQSFGVSAYQSSTVLALNQLGDAIIELAGPWPTPNFLLYTPRNHHLIDLTNQPGGATFSTGLPLPQALNNKDQVVSNGMLYSGGTFTSLLSLLPASSGWSHLNATAINDAGQIVGQGLINGQEHAFLLSPGTEPVPVPVPEPTTFAVLGLGMLAFVLQRGTFRRSSCRF